MQTRNTCVCVCVCVCVCCLGSTYKEGRKTQGCVCHRKKEGRVCLCPPACPQQDHPVTRTNRRASSRHSSKALTTHLVKLVKVIVKPVLR